MSKRLLNKQRPLGELTVAEALTRTWGERSLKAINTAMTFVLLQDARDPQMQIIAKRLVEARQNTEAILRLIESGAKNERR